METKEYQLTKPEIMAIRNALDNQWHNESKHLKPLSPIAKDIKRSTRALLDQFKQDVFELKS